MREPIACFICGRGFVPQKSTTRACSRACGMVLRSLNAGRDRCEIDWRSCQTCASLFISHHGYKWCSALCRRRRIAKHPSGAECPSCGSRFLPTRAAFKYCKPECRAIARANDGRARLNNRRRRMTSSPERFTRTEIFERDGWLCGICAEPIDPSLKWPDHWSASIDHVLPMVRGGEHVRANVQAAHWFCNAAKRDEVGFSLAR